MEDLSRAATVPLSIGYGQEAFPVVAFTRLWGGASPEDVAAAVSVPADLWAAYQGARARLVELTAEIVALDPERPDRDELSRHYGVIGGTR